jgi:hypothetical protein
MFLFLKCPVFRKPTQFLSSGKETPDMLDPLNVLLSTTGKHRRSKLLSYVPENRSSTRELQENGCWKNYKLISRHKNKTLTNTLNINPKNIHQSRQTGPQRALKFQTTRFSIY